MKKKHFTYLILSLLFFVANLTPQSVSDNNGWKELPKLLKRIKPPKFPNKEFSIIKFGAIADGKTDCTEAISKAINQCSESGGGKVIVPAGEFLTGAIHLKNNVNLHLKEGAVLKFSTDPNKYLPVVFTRWEGVECYNYSALIYAYEQKNIAVTGKGILDGQGSEENWWKWKGKKGEKNEQTQNAGRKKLIDMGENGTQLKDRILGDGYYLRPNFFQPYKCKNVFVQGVTFKDSPMWFLHPTLCENVIFDGVTTEGLGPNNDGCDPESCKDVLIKNCYFNTGDDCIAIKSGRNNDGRRVNVPSENIVIQNCKMKEGHGGVTIGSEISGGVKNVYAENCSMDSPNLDRALRFKTNAKRGGVVENFYARNIKVGQVKEAVVHIDYYYEEGEKGDFIPEMKNFNIQNVTCEKAQYGIWIKAFKKSPVKGLNIQDCNFNNIEKDNIIENVENFNFKSIFINGKKLNK